jgi:hypothetical protein
MMKFSFYGKKCFVKLEQWCSTLELLTLVGERRASKFNRALYLCIVYKIQSMKLDSLYHKNKINSNLNWKFNQYSRIKGSFIFYFAYIINLIIYSFLKFNHWAILLSNYISKNDSTLGARASLKRWTLLYWSSVRVSVSDELCIIANNYRFKYHNIFKLMLCGFTFFVQWS